jgi:multidrug efflux pump subunit AcrA (membrane-fusion protein)
MTIPLIQQGGPFQQLQAAVEAVQAQRQQRQAQALQQMTGQAELAQTQQQTASAQGQENRAQKQFEQTQQRRTEVEQAVALVGAYPEGSPGYEMAMTSALATLKQPEQIAAFRTGLEDRARTRLVAQRQRLYAGVLAEPTLANLHRALNIAMQNSDEEMVTRLTSVIAGGGYERNHSGKTRTIRVENPDTHQIEIHTLNDDGSIGPMQALAPQPRPWVFPGGAERTPEAVATEVRREIARLQTLPSPINPRRKLYPTYEAALRAALPNFGDQVTPVVRRLLRSPTAPPSTTAPAAGTKTPAQWVAEVRADPEWNGKTPAEIAAEARRRAGVR